MRLRPANKITLDNYRWALRYTLRSPVGRYISAAIFYLLDPGFQAARRELREGMYAPLP